MQRMKILYLNNYAANKAFIKSVQFDEISLWHWYGFDKLIDSEHLVFFEQFHVEKIWSKNRFIRIISTLFFQLKIFLKYRNVNFVYSSCGHLADIFAFMKAIHLFRGGLLLIQHHPVKIVFPNSYNYIICISEFVSNYLREKYPKAKIFYKYLGPYLPFYERHKLSEVQYQIISNGKSFRDFDILEKCCTELKLKTLIVGIERINTEYLTYIPNVCAVDNSLLCSMSRTMAITVNEKNNGICGITSLNDALAFEMPVLISDNARIGFNVEELGLGLIYKCGNYDSLKEKMKLLITDDFIESCKKNICRFREVNSYEKFSDFTSKLVNDYLNNKVWSK